MKSVGFPISTKENEKRRAIIPKDIKMLSHPELVFIESGYGDVLGIADNAYLTAGCQICSHDEAIKTDIICDPKIGDANYLDSLQKGQVIFGWIHATQNRDITEKIINSGVIAIAWEKMYAQGRHVFWQNNELAGEAAIIHGFQCYGFLPFGMDVAVIGNGNTAKGAVKALSMLGAKVCQYNRKQEELLRDELGKFDVVVNCVLWDLKRADHILYRTDLKRMKKNAMIIDISCDENGGIETSIPTTIKDPVYYVDGILHYVVDHTPAIFYKSFSYSNSSIIGPYINELMMEQWGDVLLDSIVIDKGTIIDQEIIEHQDL